MSETVQRDHNRPPPPQPLNEEEIRAYLDYEGERLIERRETVVTALNNFVASGGTINDDEALGEIGETMKMAAALDRTAKDRHDETKRPFRVGGEAVDAWFRVFRQPIAAAKAPVQGFMDAYVQRKLLAERKRRDEAAAEKQRLADIAARKAADALEANKPAADELQRAADADASADKAMARSHERPAEMTRVRGDYGASVSARSRWRWEVTNAALVPREYMMVNPDAVTLAAKARDANNRPTAVIPGIEWIEVVAAGVR